jgi:hypothetical protein
VDDAGAAGGEAGTGSGPSLGFPEDEPGPAGADGAPPDGLAGRPGIDPPDADSPPEAFVARDTPRPLVDQTGFDDLGDEPAGAGGDTDQGHGHGHGPDEEAGHDATMPAADGGPPATTLAAAADQPQRPWTALAVTGVLLLASLGGNCYLGMLSWGFRSRYARAVAELKRRGIRRQEPDEPELDVDAEAGSALAAEGPQFESDEAPTHREPV